MSGNVVRRVCCGITLSVGLSFTALSAQQTTAAASDAATTRYDVAELHSVMVPMRDGVHLATNVWLPAHGTEIVPGKFPVILDRTPYNADTGAAPAAVLVPQGYAVVYQDVRGRYKSEGHWRPLRDDPQDGYDTAQWIGKQAWSNQSIGMIGSSYEGATQHAIAIADAPFVKALIPRNAMSDFGLYGVRHHGAFELRWLNWVFTLGNATGTPDALPAAKRAATDDPAAAGALVEMGQHVQDYASSLPLRAEQRL